MVKGSTSFSPAASFILGCTFAIFFLDKFFLMCEIELSIDRIFSVCSDVLYPKDNQEHGQIFSSSLDRLTYIGHNVQLMSISFLIILFKLTC